MAGARGNYLDGEILHGGDLNLDLSTLLANDASILLDLLGSWSFLVSGCTASPGSGMSVNLSSGVTYSSSGIRCVLSTATVTLSPGSSSPRYDVIATKTAVVTGSNPSTGNQTNADSATYIVIPGNPSSSPVVPSLTDSSQCQVATIYVPASASNISSCSVNSQTTLPNSQGPLKTSVDLLTHIASSLASSIVHGFQATTAGGIQANRLSQTGANGGVGGANSLWDGTAFRGLYAPGVSGPNGVASYDGNGSVVTANALWDGTARRGLSVFNSGQHIPGIIPQYNANGRVEDSERLQGNVASAFDSAGAAAAVQSGVQSGAIVAASATNATNATNATTASHQSTSYRQRGTTSTAVTDSNGNAAWSVTFSPAMAALPTVLACAVNYKPGNASICETQSASSTGCTIQLCFASNSGATVQASYIADAN